MSKFFSVVRIDTPQVIHFRLIADSSLTVDGETVSIETPDITEFLKATEKGLRLGLKLYSDTTTTPGYTEWVVTIPGILGSNTTVEKRFRTEEDAKDFVAPYFASTLRQERVSIAVVVARHSVKVESQVSHHRITTEPFDTIWQRLCRGEPAVSPLSTGTTTTIYFVGSIEYQQLRDALYGAFQLASSGELS